MGSKAIFLDRDNTLIEDPGYINSPDQVKLLPSTAQALIELKKMGYLLIVITNQSAIARGIITEEGLEKIHHKFQELLALENAYIDRIYYCPFHPDGVIPKYRRESDLRKPNPGMILTAAKDLGIDLSQSWMIGNSIHDVTAGKSAGCKTILLNSYGPPETPDPNDPIPDKKAVNMKEAVNIIKMMQRRKTAAVINVSIPIEQETSEEPPQQEQPSESSQQQPPEELLLQEEPTRSESIQTSSLYTKPHKTQDKLEESLETLEKKFTTQPPDQKLDTDEHQKTHQLLQEIIMHLKIAKREELFEEFSVAKLFSGIAQVVALFCLLISFWFWMDKTRPDSAVQTMIGYAIAFQLMAVTFYLMRSRK